MSTSPAYHDHSRLTRFYEFAFNRICRTFRTLSKTRPSGELSSDDARSLEIQAQIEAEARKIAWQQTYGRLQNAPPAPAPAIPAKSEQLASQIVIPATPSGRILTSQRKLFAAIELLTLQGRDVPLDGRAIIVENVNSPLAKLSRPGDLIQLDTPEEIRMFADHVRTMDPPPWKIPGGRDKWANFRVLSAVPGGEPLPGVYAIVDAVSDRVYVGSSVDVRARLAKHLYELRNVTHHSTKLQQAWDENSGQKFRYMLLEPVADLLDLRKQEQFWIDRLGAFSRGFNMKSVADGPEPSLVTHIDRAIKTHWPRIYQPLAPTKTSCTLNEDDRATFRSDLRSSLATKAKQAGISVVLVLLTLDAPIFRILWLGVLYYVLLIVFQWPPLPKRRAEVRVEKKYREAEAKAKCEADVLLMHEISNRLGVPVERISEVYDKAPEIVVQRTAQRERYRRSPLLRMKAEFDRRRRPP